MKFIRFINVKVCVFCNENAGISVSQVIQGVLTEWYSHLRSVYF